MKKFNHRYMVVLGRKVEWSALVIVPAFKRFFVLMDKNLNNINKPILSSSMEWCPLFSISSIGFCSFSNQQVYNSSIPSHAGKMQWGVIFLITSLQYIFRIPLQPKNAMNDHEVCILASYMEWTLVVIVYFLYQ